MVQNESSGFKTKLYRGPPPVTLILWLLFSLSPNNSKYSCQSNFSFIMLLCFPKIYLYCPVYIQLNTEHFHTLSWSSMPPIVSDPTQRMHIGLILNFDPLSNITPLPPTQVILYCLHPFWRIPPSVENDSSHLLPKSCKLSEVLLEISTFCDSFSGLHWSPPSLEFHWISDKPIHA